MKKLTIDELVKQSHGLALKKGWWDSEVNEDTFAAKLALVHSEVSEALEAWRDSSDIIALYVEDGKPEGVAVELADAVIRIADLCGYFGFDLNEAIQLKHRYNKTRPYRHGGKRV